MSIYATTIKDLDLNFTINPYTKDIAKVTNLEAIKRSLKNLVLRNHYESPFHPDIGTNVYNALFELATNPLVPLNIENYILTLITNYEPRAQEVVVNVDIQPDNNVLAVTITFTPETEIISQTLTLFLDIVR